MADAEGLGTWRDAASLVSLEPAREGTPLFGAFETDQGHRGDTDGYVDALLKAAAPVGVRLRLGVAARSVSESSTGVELQTEGETLRADRLLVCAGPWSAGVAGLPSLPLKPLRGQMLVVHQPGLHLTRVVSGPSYVEARCRGDCLHGRDELHKNRRAACLERTAQPPPGPARQANEIRGRNPADGRPPAHLGQPPPGAAASAPDASRVTLAEATS